MEEVTLLAVTGMQKCDTIAPAARLTSRKTVDDDLAHVCVFSAEKKKLFNQTFSLAVKATPKIRHSLIDTIGSVSGNKK